MKKDKPKKIKTKFTRLVKEIKDCYPETEIALSSVIHRTDDKSLNNKIVQVNNWLENFCRDNSLSFIDNNNIKDECLNKGGLHLNRRGISNLSSNFRKAINDH